MRTVEQAMFTAVLATLVGVLVVLAVHRLGYVKGRRDARIRVEVLHDEGVLVEHLPDGSTVHVKAAGIRVPQNEISFEYAASRTTRPAHESPRQVRDPA